MPYLNAPLNRPGPCNHPSITDEQLETSVVDSYRFGETINLKCPDCSEWLYPQGDTVYAGEPKGAGDSRED